MAFSRLDVSRTRAASTALLAALSFVVVVRANSQSQQTQQSTVPIYGGSASSQQQSGSATGGTFAPVLDSEKRPITAGGFVKTGPIIYQDVSKEAGLNVLQHRMGNSQENFIIEST